MSVHGAFFLILVFLSLRDALGYAEPVDKAGFKPVRERVFAEAAASDTRRGNALAAASVTWKYLGGEALSRPCCVSWGPGRVDCFIRGPTSNVLHRVTSTSEPGFFYSDWTDLGGIIIDEIECVSRGPGLIDIVVLGTDNVLYTKSYASGSWTDYWFMIPDTWAYEVPSCVARTSALVECMYRMSDLEGIYLAASDGRWETPLKVGGVLRGPVGCSSRIAHEFDCYSTDVGNSLYEKWLTQDTWKGWVSLEGKVRGRPSVTNWAEPRVDVFVLGMQNEVMWKVWEGEWLDWVNLGGTFDSEPECVTTGVGKIHCFAIGPRSWLYRNSLAEETWSGWTADDTGLIFLETPSCVVSGQDEVSCYARDSTKGITQIVYQF